MRLPLAIGVRVALALVILSFADPPAAQSLSASTRSGPMTVLAIDDHTGRIVCLSGEGQVSVDEVDRSGVVITEEARRADLALLRAGAIIRAESRDGTVHTITVLRRTWSEMEGPDG